ncbi:thyroid peroxidase isoform X2 [Puntigrus tetrazona]|uniref:thyroid peroxidase isoform X2 n=1 Tax=Puntigrus tetrazona TaxID=1606681 RepID=UPI001C894899|nr:thyroid peroxidase isoform X2 [Puntigrus tetrazona]
MAGVLTRLTSVLMFCAASTDSFHSSQLVPESLIISSFQESLQTVDAAASRGFDPQLSHMYALSRRPASETQHLSRSAEIFHLTLGLLKEKASRRHERSLAVSELLSAEAAERIANLSGCPRALHPGTCAKDGKYRSISGVCNNRKNPLWGAANAGLARWLPAEYEDGENQPKGWNAGRRYRGFQLPLVREVSNKMVGSSSMAVPEDSSYSQMLVDWGQYIDHDISFTPQSSGRSRCLQTCSNAEPCFPVQIPKDDKLSGSKSCLPFFRSSPACVNVHAALQRQQMNSVSSFIDASSVYGSSAALEESLRNLSSAEGLLAVSGQYSDGGRPYLPSAGPSACLQEPGSGPAERVECFTAGDSRVNEILPLSVLHTLWVREHNRLAGRLARLNPRWGSEVIYQETRKIIGALHQIITMRDYVPKIMGREAFEEYIGPYSGYDERLNESFQEHQRFSSLSLQQTFFSPWRLVREGGLDPVLRALLGRPAALQNQEHLMTEDLTQRLLVLNIPDSLDLAALNLQRGRDHGLPGYNDWRAFCGFGRVESRSDLMEVVGSGDSVQKVMDVYGHPDNIDVWLGGLLERPASGARTGPLFACLIGKQMKALREGDRFWWERPGVFSPKQRQELQTHSLSRVICDNSGVTEVPLDAFRRSSYPEDFVSCGNVPSMDLEAWRDHL